VQFWYSEPRIAGDAACRKAVFRAKIATLLRHFEPPD
jgi:hypothetical protein